jgi:hypothetical protein
MSAASFISMAGIVAFTGNGYAGSVYLMGWTGGYVLLALLLAPYLRKFGKYTIPDFVGDRYSETARLVAVSPRWSSPSSTSPARWRASAWSSSASSTSAPPPAS